LLFQLVLFQEASPPKFCIHSSSPSSWSHAHHIIASKLRSSSLRDFLTSVFLGQPTSLSMFQISYPFCVA
jgi:hypothetical protein